MGDGPAAQAAHQVAEALEQSSADLQPLGTRPVLRRLRRLVRSAAIPALVASAGIVVAITLVRRGPLTAHRGDAVVITKGCAMITEFRIQPLSDRVVVKPAQREAQTKGGIYLPDTASKERPMEGTILAVGAGRVDDSGRHVPMQVKVGDTVLFAKYGGTEYRVDDNEYLILSEKDILGIIQA